MSATDGMRADWANKDFYAELGVKKDADGRRDQEGLPQARARQPPRLPTRATPPSTRSSRRWPRRTTSSATPRSARSTTRCATSTPARLPGRFPGARRWRWRRRSTSTTCCATAPAAVAASATCSATSSGAAGPATQPRRAARRAPTSRPTATIGFTEALDGQTLSLRLTTDAPARTARAPAQARHHAARLPDLRRRRHRVASVGGAFSMNEHARPASAAARVRRAVPVCHGSGRGLSARTIQARIPAGVKDGQRIRLRGKGAAGENGGPAGDLFVTVKVAPHPLFGRKGDNLTLDVPVPFDEAVLGAEIKVPTLQGAPVTLKIPAGTPNGRTFRVRGKGAPQGRRHEGDLLATVDVQVPALLDGRGPGGGRGLPRAPPPARRRCARPRSEAWLTAGARASTAAAPGPDVPVFVISVAAELTGLHPQTLRTYDRLDWSHRAAPAAAAAATPSATSSCSASRRADRLRHRPGGRPPDPGQLEPPRRAGPGSGVRPRCRATGGERGDLAEQLDVAVAVTAPAATRTAGMIRPIRS